MFTDHTCRKRLVDAMQRYLREETSAFEFEAEIFDIRLETEDQTVHRVVDTMWFYYDDFRDHQVVLSRADWDYFHRLILVLQSDAHLELATQHTWSARQLVAAAALAMFLAYALSFGFGPHLFFIAAALGVLSICLARTSESSPKTPFAESGLAPFTSLSQLAQARRRVPDFHKRPYPPHLSWRRIRSPSTEAVLTLHTYLLWLKLAPLFIFLQMFPQVRQTLRVVS